MRKLSVSPRFLSLRTSSLNGAVSRPSMAARSGARRSGCSAIRARTGPVHGPVLLARSSRVEPAIDRGDVVGRQLGGVRELGAGVRLVHEVERDPVHGEVVVALAAARAARPVWVRPRGDASAARMRDGETMSTVSTSMMPRGRAVAPPRDGLRALPPPERERDRTVPDPRPCVLREEHRASVEIARTSSATRCWRDGTEASTMDGCSTTTTGTGRTTSIRAGSPTASTSCSCPTTIDAHAKAFIEARDMFFLATCDADGQPAVLLQGRRPGLRARRRRAHARVPGLRRQRDVPVARQHPRPGPRRDAVRRLRTAEPAPRQRRRHRRRGRSAPRRVHGRDAGGPSADDAGVSRTAGGTSTRCSWSSAPRSCRARRPTPPIPDWKRMTWAQELPAGGRPRGVRPDRLTVPPRFIGVTDVRTSKRKESMLGSPGVGGRSVRAATRANRFGTGRHEPMRQIARKGTRSTPRGSSEPGRILHVCPGYSV